MSAFQIPQLSNLQRERGTAFFGPEFEVPAHDCLEELLCACGSNEELHGGAEPSISWSVSK